MRCFEKQIIFDFIKGELSARQQKQVESHLAVCEDCRKIHDNLQNDFHLVQESVEQLNAQTVPEMLLIAGENQNRKKKFHPMLLPDWLIKSKFQLKFGLAVAIFCCLLVVFYPNHQTQIDEEELVERIIATEEFLNSDQISEGARFYNIYDEQTKEIMIIQLNQNSETPLINTIKINEYNQNGG